MRRDFRADRSGRTEGGVLSDLQRLFMQSSLYAALTSALTLQKGTGAISFTRASAKTGIDCYGNQFTAKANEVVTTGTRRVENLCKSTDSLVPWTKSLCTAIDNNAIAPDGTMTAHTITATGNGYIYSSVISSYPVASYRYSMWVRRKTGTGVIVVYPDAHSNPTNIASLIVSGLWTNIALSVNSSAISIAVELDIQTAGDEIEIWHPQLEYMGGLPNINQSSEYVPSTEMSAGAAGVKYFETYQDGTPIPANLLKGASVEPDSQNVLFPSATLTTQSQTVTAGTWTLSFYGTGSVVMSGVATGTLAGTGAANPVQLTVTAIAGSVTFTVTGSVTKAQFEPLPYASSNIPTTTAPVARTKDILALPTAGNLVAAQGAISLTFTPDHNESGTIFLFSCLGASDGFYMSWSGGALALAKRVSNVDTGIAIAATYYKDTQVKIAFRFGAFGFQFSCNGVTSILNTEGTSIPLPAMADVGHFLGSLQAGGCFKDIRFYQVYLSEADLIRITS